METLNNHISETKMKNNFGIIIAEPVGILKAIMQGGKYVTTVNGVSKQWEVVGENMYETNNNKKVSDCYNLKVLLEMEFKKVTDWNEIKPDTKVLVRDCEDDEWQRAYFSKYANEQFFCFRGGRTSWSSIKGGCDKDGYGKVGWNYAILVEEEE